MKSSVIVFPGSNCDRDIADALVKMQFKNQMVWHKETKLPKSDLIVVPGGFSYGDYLRSGAIAGKSLIINEVIKAANDGCLILGICNGAQVLVESGLVPEDQVSDWNARYKYYVPLQGFAEDTLIDPETGREIERRQSKNNLINSQMTVSGTLVKQAKGRESLADSPLQQSVIQVTGAAITAEKNRVTTALANLSRAFPNDSIWSVSEDVGQIKTVDSMWDPTKGRSRVGFKENGVQKYIEIYDKRLAKGFDNFDTAVAGTLMEMTR